MTHTYKNNLNKGYAILFAVVIVSIISLLAIGLSNSTYKQLILSSLAKDSQTAFFQADTATECALYADNVVGMTPTYGSWFCGKSTINDNDNPFDVVAGAGPDDYELISTGSGSAPCYEMTILKDTSTSPVETIIKGRGYNSCDKSSPKTVQREIEVRY
jgi:hypothetical protein